ncbi:hypothetical protein D9619_011277 [Psilocybe cf. subviscida]|uniref:Uncharacterized protein n=1 Tax=Psilocybe cf. subviscida TaxID=2480587 RepID=A0A8H5F5A2_9AGAR|nr:hypothetical protein D9619_011277 [Psilocybe cf. subviscida]
MSFRVDPTAAMTTTHPTSDVLAPNPQPPGLSRPGHVIAVEEIQGDTTLFPSHRRWYLPHHLLVVAAISVRIARPTPITYSSPTVSSTGPLKSPRAGIQSSLSRATVLAAVALTPPPCASLCRTRILLQRRLRVLSITISRPIWPIALIASLVRLRIPHLHMHPPQRHWHSVFFRRTRISRSASRDVFSSHFGQLQVRSTIPPLCLSCVNNVS